MSESTVFKDILNIALKQPDSIAIEGNTFKASYQNLVSLIGQCSSYIKKTSKTVFAIDLDNTPEWAIIDLALLSVKKVCIPIPGFFTNSQIQHLLRNGGVQIVFTYTPNKFNGVIDRSFDLCGRKVYQVSLNNSPVKHPVGTVKITYTSGTTGEPKGVCITSAAIYDTVHSIVKRSEVNNSDRHFSALPMTTLLENIAGLYVTLVCGATAIIYSQESIGVSGATGINPQKFIQTMNEHTPTTTILIPQMLDVMVGVMGLGVEYLKSMKFIAVGGAPISIKILEKAKALNLPVYEGYGLSESTSVVTVNGPSSKKIGTVGKPLDHIDLKIADDKEVLVRGAMFKGYLGDSSNSLDEDGYLSTGDIGFIDEEGFLVLQGRKKNIFITSFGRNIAPEWIERELIAQPEIIQAAIFGEAKPWNTAIIFALPGASIDKAIQRANETLPDYWQMSHFQWLTLS